MISKGRTSSEYIDLSHLNQAGIAAYYLGIKSIPCLISSPLRKDEKPSFSLFQGTSGEILYKDYSTGDSGNLFKLLSLLWNYEFRNTLERIKKECSHLDYINTHRGSYKSRIPISKPGMDLQVKVRNWESYDIEYWESYGISLEWLKFADVYPISHKILVDSINQKQYCSFKSDKYAYAYVEFKEGKTTIKIYQPFNTKGYKWANRHDKSVISLWTKVPSYGNRVCICSSMKDALCLWENTGIPSLAIQGEGYNISDTAVNELKRRFKQIFIFLDNDEAGLKNGEALASKTGFTNIVLPQFEGGKDISDYYKSLSDKTLFKQTILNLFL